MNVPPGASGSSTTRTRLLASGGMFAKDNWGLMFSPSQVYLAGILPLSVNESLWIIIFARGGGEVGRGEGCV